MLTIKFSLTAFYKRAKGLGTAVKVRKRERRIVLQHFGKACYSLMILVSHKPKGGNIEIQSIVSNWTLSVL